MTSNSANTSDREIVISRVLDAPRELVFEAWTDPRHLPHWWGPNGFTTTTLDIEVRPGGVWNFIMHGPDGRDYPNRIVFKEIVRPERIEYAHCGDGGAADFQTIVTFVAEGNKTRLTARMTFPTAEVRDFVVREYGAIEGGEQHLERLAGHVKRMESEAKTEFVIEPGKPFFTICRVFDAPRSLVFDAITMPEHLRCWYGPRGSVLTTCDMDLRPGGSWRFVMRMPDGSEHGFNGEYRDIVPPERLVQTWRWEGFPEGKSVETLVLVEKNGKTEMTVTVTHKSVEYRDGHIGSGMEGGTRETFARLAELVETVA